MIFYYGEKSVELEKFSYSLNEEFIQVSSNQELNQKLKSQTSSSVVVLSSDTPLAEAIAVSEKLRLEFPTVKALLSRKRLDVDTLTKALRAGISEVVLADDASSFVQSIHHLREIDKVNKSNSRNLDSRKTQGKIIVVFSAKGGCGKTTLSINLATALSELVSGKVCLVDLDLQFGDVAVSMQTEPEKTISAAIPMGVNLDLLGVRSIITPFDSKLDLLLAPNNPTDVEYISGDLVGKILENLVFDYEFIVIDTPPAFTDFVLKSLELMDLCFLITTLEMPSIKNLKVVLHTLEALKVNESLLRLVINRSNVKTGIARNEVEDLLGMNVNYELNNQLEVSVATNQGLPTIRYAPKAQISLEIMKMAKDIDALFSPQTKLEKSKRRLFSRKARS